MWLNSIESPDWIMRGQPMSTVAVQAALEEIGPTSSTGLLARRLETARRIGVVPLAETNS
jgi:hypothetical protein